MTNELKVFESTEFGSVRVVEKDGEPWFVARDVCSILGFDEAHTNMALKGLDDDEKTTSIKMVGRHDFKGLRKDAPLVSEPGLYSLILRSNKPEAKAFKRWVTHDILPSIRKHGVYAVEAVLDDPDMLINALQALKAERAARIHAERTKAEIGSRREATAMATASAATRKANILEAQLGIAGDYRAVKGIKWLPDMFNLSKSATYQQIGKYIKKLSLNMGYAVKQAPDSLHESVGLYHVDVIKAFLDDLNEHPSLLSKYRHA